VTQAKRAAETEKQGGAVKLVRKSVRMSVFGREFWAASDPSRPALPSA